MPIANIDLGLVEQFGSESKCREYLAELRWPDGVLCPRCASTKVTNLSSRDKFGCVDCEYQFSVRVGTVLQDSKLPLWKWFLATYLLCESEKGMSANQVKRMIGVSYKTAWFLCHRIRHAMSTLVERPLSGIVQVDEVPADSRTGRGYLVERNGSVRINVRTQADHETLRAFIEKCAPGAERVITANGTTDSAESVLGLLEHSILGAFHRVSAAHLPRYIDELEWRFNNRDNPYLFRDTLVALVDSEIMTYAKLIA